MDPCALDPTGRWRDRSAAQLVTLTGPRHFDAERGLFRRGRLLARSAYTHLWPFACAWSALETASGLGGETGARAAGAAEALRRGLSAYDPGGEADRGVPVGYQSSVVPPLGPGGDVFYDDNAWVALTLLAHHRRTQDADSLAMARRVVEFCCTGWSIEPGWAVPGGIRWKVSAANRSRNACANAPVAQAAAQLFTRTGDAQFLAWAVRIYDWVRAALLGPGDLYLDRIMPDGGRAPERWTYNQGTMIGAGVLLAEATGEGHYLAEACATAEAALARYDVQALLHPNGPAFNAIFFRNLFLLDRRVPDPRIAALAADYGRATRRGWVRRWVELRPGAPWSLAAAGPLLEIGALLAGATPHP